jgi:hypothetical protein
MTSEYSNYEPELTLGERVRGVLILVIVLGGGLFLLIREVFF